MELWIRSQDKESLIPVNERIFILDLHNGRNIEIKCGSYSVIGIYKSKERALEVLDEIQKLITGKIICNTYDKEKYKFNGIYKPEDIRKEMEELGIVGLCADVSCDIQQLGDNVIYEMPEE